LEDRLAQVRLKHLQEAVVTGVDPAALVEPLNQAYAESRRGHYGYRERHDHDPPERPQAAKHRL
jgi:hypothetical protein